MVAPIRFLSGRQQQQKIGVQGSTEDQKVLEVIGRVGIGSTIFDPSVDLDIRGDVNISGNLTIGDQQGAALSAESLFISGFSTFVGHSTFQNGVTISGVSTFVGFSTFQSDVHLDSNLNVSGIITASSLDITGEGGTGGQASLDNLRVSGFSTFVGVSTFENGFNVSGVSTFIGNANFDSDVDIDGHTELDDLNVSGVSTFQNKVHLLDDDELHFGGSAGGNGDTTIGHDESNTTIAHTGEGNLQVKVAAGKTFSISKFADSDKIADFDVDGAVRLYYDGSEKLSTTSIGASVSNGAASTATLSGPGTLIIDPAPVGDNGGVLRIKGDLYVDGTQTIVNSSTVEIADKVIGIATTSVSDLLLDGAGIGIGSEGNRKTFLYEYNGSVNPSLKSSENLNVATGKVYQVGETEVLSADTLSVGTGATVHSPAANVLTLGTAGQERIFIDANGNVGVGTNIPVGFSSNTNTTILHAGIVTAVKYFGSGGDLEDLIKEKLEGVTTKFVDSEGTISGIGSELNVVSITIDNSNATVGYITAVGFGSTAIYYFNDVTAVGLTSDANINTSGIITTSSLNVTGDSTFDQNLNITQGLSVSGVLTTTSISGSPVFDGLSVTGVSTLGNVTAGVLTASVIVGDGSGLTGLAGVAAGVTVTDNNATVGTAAILNFGPDLDVTPISSGIVTFSLNDNQSLGILTSTRIESTNADLTNINVGLATITQLGGISTLGIGTIFEIKTDNIDGGRFFVESNVGEIFVITNTITDGSLFSVNDSGGIPLLDIEDDNIQLTPFGSGNFVGVGKTNPQAKLDVNGDAVVNGSVGIGTTNPQAKLDVRGNALIDGYVAIGTNTPFISNNSTNSKVTIDVGVGTDDIGLSVVSGFTTTYDGFQSGGLETIYRGLNIINNVASDYNTAVLQLNAINSSGYNNPWYLGAISTPELGRGGQFFIGHRDNAAPNDRAEVLRIGTDGEVGIGTTAPSRTLDVNGDIRIRGALYDSSNSAGSAGVVLSSTGAGVSWTTATTTASGQSILEASASTLYYISASPIISGVSTAGFVESDIVIKDGNLGVGTDDPQAKLHAVGLSSDKFIFDSNNSLQIPSGTEAQKETVGTAVTGQIRFNTTNQQFEGFGVGNNWGSLGGVKDVDGDTYILAELTPGSDEDQLYFYSGGNLSGTISSTTGAVYNVDVGIGTSNPQASLHVVDEFLLTTAGAASTQRITQKAYTTDNGSLSWEGSAGQLFSITNNLTSGSIFSVNDVSGVPSIDVDADGRVLLAPYGSNEYVGVGKTNPQAKLDVNGGFKVSGVSTFQDDVNIGVGGTTAFFDVSTGNIGIGTDNPLVALDVAGNIRQELHTPAMPVGLNEDIGLNWTKVNIAGAGLAVNHIDSLAYCGDGIVLAGDGSTGGDIYRSTDYGLTFTQIELDSMTGEDYEFIFAIVYCGNGIALAGAGFESGDGDILRSTDYGVTWTKSYDAGATIEYFVSLTYCGNGIVLAGSANGTGDGDVYRSTDFGLTFTKIEMGADLEQIRSLEYCGDGIALAGAGDSNNDGDIYRSTDYGATWTKVYEGSGLTQIVAIEYCGNGIVLAGGGNGSNDGNVYRSTDYGLTYTQIEVDTALEEIASLAYCDNGIVLAGGGSGTGDGDIFKSADYGLTWTKIEMEPPGSGLETIRSLLYLGNGIVLAGSRIPGDIYRSEVGFSQATSLQGVYHEHLTGNIGIGTTTPTTKLHVIGEVTATDYNSTSDARLKTNVHVIEDPLEKVLQINGVSFNWIKDNKPSMGVIADNIQEVLPELVSDTDPKTVNYNGLIGLLIECVKQQQVEIEELKRKIG